MTKAEFLAVLDKHIDQEGLAKDLAMMAVVPYLESMKAKVESKEIDLIPSTEIENVLLVKVLDQLIAKE
jgi:hypothetical protein